MCPFKILISIGVILSEAKNLSESTLYIRKSQNTTQKIVKNIIFLLKISQKFVNRCYNYKT